MDQKDNIKPSGSGANSEASGSGATSGATGSGCGSQQTPTSNSNNQMQSSRVAIGLQRNLEPECIIGAVDHNGELLFLMKWRNSDHCDLVLSSEAKQRFPQLVIQFYEDRITFYD